MKLMYSQNNPAGSSQAREALRSRPADSGPHRFPQEASMGERTDMTRSAAVAGYFYSREADALRGEITALMREGAALRERQAPGLAGLFGQGTTLPGGARHPLMVLLPHAGYMYSGAVACAALAGVELPRRLIVLGPSHTGVGHMQGFWPEGAWRTPLGDIPVDAELGKELESLGGGFAPDIACHMREHAIEVLLPFLRFARPDCSILPVTIGMPSAPGGLAKAALALAEVLKRHAGEEGGPREVGLVVSSDMNHFENEAHTRELDEAALRPLLVLDASLLLREVHGRGISMCGALPAALGVMACRALGASHAHLCAHDTSAAASGDTRRVVGYASALVW